MFSHLFADLAVGIENTAFVLGDHHLLYERWDFYDTHLSCLALKQGHVA